MAREPTARDRKALAVIGESQGPKGLAQGRGACRRPAAAHRGRVIAGEQGLPTDWSHEPGSGKSGLPAAYATISSGESRAANVSVVPLSRASENLTARP